MSSNEVIHEQIAKYLSGEASPEEAMQVEAWGNQSKENKSYLEDCFRIFKLSSNKFDATKKKEVWENIEAHIKATKLTSKVKKLWAVGIAASLLLVILAGVLLNKKQETYYTIVHQAKAQSQKVLLQDATEMTLAPYATAVLDKHYGLKNRNITLKGTASFLVKHDDTKPFVVSVGNLHIKDLGTGFTITSAPKSDEIHVVVEEGTVLVYDDSNKRINLNAGEGITYQKFTKQFLNFQEPNDTTINNREKEKKAILKRPSIKTITDTNIQRKGAALITDTGVNLSLDEATTILGGQAKMVNNDKNKNDGLIKYSRLFRLKSDASVALSSEIEYFFDDAAAHKALERLRLKYTSAKNVTGLAGNNAEGFYQTDNAKYYLLVFRKQNVLFRITINKLNKEFSNEALVKALKSKAQQIK